MTSNGVNIRDFLSSKQTDADIRNLYLGMEFNLDRREIQFLDVVEINKNTGQLRKQMFPVIINVVAVMTIVIKNTDIVIASVPVSGDELVLLEKTIGKLMTGIQIRVNKKRNYYSVDSFLDSHMEDNKGEKRRLADERSDHVYNTEMIDIKFINIE